MTAKTAGAWILGLALATAAPAQAKKIVYSPIVDEGEKEIEYYVDWHEGADGADRVDHELSLEYAFGPRDQVALYGVWHDTSPEGLAFVEHKVEWIHQLFEQGERTWDAGTYLEYEVPAETAGSADEVEFKVLLERTFPHTTVTLNPIFKKELGNNAAASTEAAYAARWAWRGPRGVQAALEAYGDLGEIGNPEKWDDQSHVIGPVVDLRLGQHVRWQVGTLFGITSGSEDVRVKSQVALEWY